MFADKLSFEQKWMHKLHVQDMYPDASHLDAVQGSSEARTELHQEVLLGSTTVADAVMRQESGQATELGSEAGQDGGGAW